MAAPGPPFVGLTGAIAAGKSEALAALGRLGAATFSTDAAAHDLLEEPATLKRLVERWGEDVAAGGTVDRGRIATIVFNRPEELHWMESVLHPLVGERVADWRAALDPAVELAVVEVPLLFEAGMEGMFDATLVVVAGDERRAQWAAARGTGEVEGRSTRQLTGDEKAKRATFVVRNDGSLEDLERALGALWPRLLAAGGGG